MIRSHAAQTPGVDLLLGHQVTGVIRAAGRTVGVRASTPQGEREIRARLVVGADGKDSAVAKFAGMPARLHENARFGYLDALPKPSAARRGGADYPLHSRKPTAPGVALIGDAALTGDPLWGVGCGWALQSAQWLTEAVAQAATGRGDLDRAVAVYARRHRHRLRGHQYLAADFATARPFNPLERLMFSAAARDASVARHMHLFASRLIGPLRFLSPIAMAKASAVNLRHRGATALTPRPSRSGS
ncbi:FAD-dependent monooxygenase [Streptomyces sp. NPDC054849]